MDNEDTSVVKMLKIISSYFSYTLHFFPLGRTRMSAKRKAATGSQEDVSTD